MRAKTRQRASFPLDIHNPRFMRLTEKVTRRPFEFSHPPRRCAVECNALLTLDATNALQQSDVDNIAPR
jgi:hypothetical protein